MLTNILESPFSPPEMIVLQILKCKIKLNALKALPNQSTCDYKKCKLRINVIFMTNILWFKFGYI